MLKKSKAPSETSDSTSELHDIADEELLRRFINRNDRGAFEELAMRYHGLAFRLALQITKRPSVAEEASQDAFMDLFQKGDRFKYQGPGSFKRWFVVFVLNHARTKFRAEQACKRRTQRQQFQQELKVLHSSDSETKERSCEVHEKFQALNEAMISLEEQYRIPIALSFLEKMPQAEIASLLDLSVRQIQNRISTGLELLRKRMSRKGMSLASAGILTLLHEALPIPIPSHALRKLSKKAWAHADDESRSNHTTPILIATAMLFIGAIMAGIATTTQSASDPTAQKTERLPIKRPTNHPTVERGQKILLDFNDPKTARKRLRDESWSYLPKGGHLGTGGFKVANESASMTIKLQTKTLPLSFSFYSFSHSKENNVQAICKQHRPGTKCTVIWLEGKNKKNRFGKWVHRSLIVTRYNTSYWIDGQLDSMAFYDYAEEKPPGAVIDLIALKGAIIDNIALEPTEAPDLAAYLKAAQRIPMAARNDTTVIPGISSDPTSTRYHVEFIDY